MNRASPDRTRPNPPRIALLVGAWNEYGRGIIEGVWQYAQQHGPWLLDLQSSQPDESTTVPRGWTGAGAIAAIHTRRIANKLRALRVPVVNVSGSRRANTEFVRVTSDANAVVRMAITHLQEKGLKRVAFCGEPHRPFIDFWTKAYRTVIEEAGMERMIYTPSSKVGPRSGLQARHRDRLRWVESLPKPVGVIGWYTELCRQIAAGCTESRVKVPEEVAIISLATEKFLGKVVHPPISGVDIPVERIGYEAAAQLDRLMQGKNPSHREIRLPPLGVTTRQSSDVVACDDPAIRQAMHYIRDHAHEGIDVRAVLKAVPMARRTLERRFQDLLGRSPAEEIRRVKIERVRGMLDSTSISIPDIAEACGFKYVEHMIPIFKRYHGCTPARYRRQRMKT